MPSRVLVVEDEPDIRELVIHDLKREGYQVSAAASGEEALRQVLSAPPDLVLLDLMMPAMDGLEVCRRLRQDPSTATLPIVMLTAKGDEVDRVLGLEIGADDYVVKPFSPKELLARVRAVLRRSRNATGPASTPVAALTSDRGAHTVAVAGEGGRRASGRGRRGAAGGHRAGVRGGGGRDGVGARHADRAGGARRRRLRADRGHSGVRGELRRPSRGPRGARRRHEPRHS